MRLRVLAKQREGSSGGDAAGAEAAAEQGGVKAVVVSPTKELSVQTARVLKLLLPGLRIRCSVLSKATAAGTDFSKVRPAADAAGLELAPDSSCLLLPLLLRCLLPLPATLLCLEPHFPCTPQPTSPLKPTLCSPMLLPFSPQVDVLLAQPLRLGAMAEEGKVDLSSVQLLILDEADKLFGMGFTEQVGGGGQVTRPDH